MADIKRPVKAVDARRWYRLGEEDSWHVVDAAGRLIAVCEGADDAEAIAAALNQHDALVDALREAREALVLMVDVFGPLVSVRAVSEENARAVIRKIDEVLGEAERA